MNIGSTTTQEYYYLDYLFKIGLDKFRIDCT